MHISFFSDNLFIFPQDLLKCIHRYASEFYTESGQLLNSSRDYRKERKKRSDEKKAKGRSSTSKRHRDMYKVFDGSAIMAIGKQTLLLRFVNICPSTFDSKACWFKNISLRHLTLNHQTSGEKKMRGTRILIWSIYNKNECLFYDGGRVPSLQLRIIFPPMMPIRSDGNILRRPRRRSRSLFFGNMPDTACRMICKITMGHLRTRIYNMKRTSSGCLFFMSLYGVSFSPPGNIECFRKSDCSSFLPDTLTFVEFVTIT